MTGYEGLEPIRPIGSEGAPAGAAFRARRVSDGAVVALKQLQATGNPAWIGTVAGRARRVAGLAPDLGPDLGPALPRIFEVSETEGACTIAMEYAPNGSLADRLEDGSAGAPQEVAELFARLADGLAVAHAAGILHLDIKPANVLFRSDGEAFLSDFGHDRLAETTGQPSPDTAGYLDPAVAEGEPPDARSDVFSLGAVCYQALAGFAPFSGETLVEVAEAAREGSFRSLAEAVPGLAPGVARAVERALDPSPQRRHQGAGDFAAALRAASSPPATAGLPVAAAAWAGSGRWHRAWPPVGSWRPVGLVALLASVVLVAAAVASPLLGRTGAKRQAAVAGSSGPSPSGPSPSATPEVPGPGLVTAPTQTAGPAPGTTAPASAPPQPSTRAAPRPPSSPAKASPAPAVVAARPTAPALPSSPAPPQLPPRGQRIAFAGTRGGKGSIYAINSGGGPTLQLTNTTSGDDSQPAWSPDGSRIAFTSSRDGRRQIYVMNADGSGQQRLSANAASVNSASANEDSPAWSPDGRIIAYVSDVEGPSAAKIWSMPATGGPGHLLGPVVASGPILGAYFDPSWSPDGRRIVFAQRLSGLVNIFVMNADGTGLVGLTRINDPPARYPRWSPDGTRITFTRWMNGGGQIWAMNADGSGPAQTGSSASADQEPVWSPGGDRIAFVGIVGGASQIWLMGADGSNPARITYGLEAAFDPAWG